MVTLQDYPGLADWFRQRPSFETSSANTKKDVTDLLVWRLCHALDAPKSSMIDQYCHAFDQYLQESEDHLKDLLGAISIFQSCDADFLEQLSDVGEQAAKIGRVTSFRKMVSQVAAKTELAAIHFLAAWSALNDGDLLGCIDECETVKEPYASLHTIHGQALLELGQVEEAIEVLVMATKLSPTELLAWFQLAKAYHVSGRLDVAWIALKQCQRLAPQSEEVALFLAMTALQPSNHKSDEKAHDAFWALSQFLPQMAGSGIVVGTLAQLACQLEDKGKMQQVLNASDWHYLKRSADFVKHLPPVLRAFNDLGWMDLARRLLQQMTTEKSA